EGLRSQLHDSIVLELELLLRYSGYWTVHEERNLFHNDQQDKYSRPDISINNPNNLQYNTGRQPIQKVIIDVSFTCVLEGVQDGKIKSASNRNNAMKVGSKAHT